MEADVIVVGGGHNGLICAAYLARAGVNTLLLEAAPDVGGCASTVDDLGARFNICNCDHTLVRAMPIIDELDLVEHGLRYVEPEAGSIWTFHDGSDPWVIFHDQDRTLGGLAEAYPDQADAYRRYLVDAMPVARLALDMVRTPPPAARFAAVARMVPSQPRRGTWPLLRRLAADHARGDGRPDGLGSCSRNPRYRAGSDWLRHEAPGS